MTAQSGPGGGGVRLRTALAGLPAYVPGRPPAQGAAGESAPYKLSSNENPYPPLPSVLEVVREAALELNRYPDMANSAVTEALAGHLGVPVAQVALGPGSVGVLGQILAATCDPDDEVVYAWRSFEAYPIVAGIAGAASVRVPLDADGRHDLAAMADAVTERTRLVLVCSPNNPTGPAVHQGELDTFLDRVPDDVLVVVDEAYVEFVRDPAVVDAMATFRARGNVAVLRTFSKAYGLAGLRIGYAVAPEPVAEALRQTAIPFAVSGIAQRAAIASLAATGELFERVDALVAERERVAAALREQGWRLPETQANCVWLPLGADTPAFAAAAQEAGLTVRPFGAEGARCTVAETAANGRLIEVCEAFARATRGHLAGTGAPSAPSNGRTQARAEGGAVDGRTTRSPTAPAADHS